MLTAELSHIKDFHHWKVLPNGVYDVGFFASMVPNKLNGGYIGACRTGRCEQGKDIIDILHYDNDLNLVYRTPITKGEDPRCFEYNNIPYAITWAPSWDINGQPTLEYKIINLIEEKVLSLLIDGLPKCPYYHTLGKNWMPLEKDGELYLVVLLNPLYILKCDLATGICSWLPGFELKGVIDNHETQVDISRGGTPFIFHEKHGRYVGLGHRSYDGRNHSSFLYTLDENFKEVFVGKDLNTGKGEVQDPHSIFCEDGKLYSCISHYDPWVSKAGESGLYELKL